MTEHIYEHPGYDEERSFSETVPMIPAWQYREDGRPVAPAAHVSPDSEAVWVYPPYSSEGTLEIVNEIERLNLDERLARDNHILSRLMYNHAESDDAVAHILHAFEPVQPCGMDATYAYRTTVSEKLGDLECHVCFENNEDEAEYVNEANRLWTGICEILSEEDLGDCGMPLRLVAGLLCMLELRRRMDRTVVTDSLSTNDAIDIVSYVIIEHEMRGKNLGEMNEDKWNFVKGIYAVRNALQLF